MIRLNMNVRISEAQLDEFSALETRADPRKPWKVDEKRTLARRRIARMLASHGIDSENFIDGKEVS